MRIVRTFSSLIGVVGTRYLTVKSCEAVARICWSKRSAHTRSVWPERVLKHRPVSSRQYFTSCMSV